MLNYNKLHKVLFCKAKAWFIIIGIIAIPEVLRADLDVFMGCKCWLNTGTPGVWERKMAWDIGPYPDSVYVHSSFCDLDNDGDYDAYVTRDVSLITAFENVGSDTAPNWQRKPSWDFNPSDMGLVFWADFIDIDDDGKCDLSVAEHDTIKFYKNTGTSLFVWTRESAWDIYVDGCNLGHSYADLDNDGDYDFMARLWFARKIKAFENIGSITNPVWQEKPVWAPNPEPDLLSLGDLDGDTDVDIIGGGISWATSFENTGTITNPVWTERSGWCTPDAHRPFYPELIDIDSDGPSGVEEKHFAPHQRFITIYPNPFTQKTVIRVRFSCLDHHEPPTRITIYDLAGRLVKSFPHTGLETIHNSSIGSDGRFAIHKVTWDGTDNNGKKVKSGIYFCKFQANNYTVTKKLSLIK